MASKKSSSSVKERLFNAITFGKLEDVKNLLLESREAADVNEIYEGNQSALHIAIAYDKSMIACFLVERKAKVNVKNKEGATPLHCAAAKNDLELAKLLIKRGAEMEIAEFSYGLTPLLRAALDENVDMVKLLQEKGASINMEDIYKGTPFFAYPYFVPTLLK